MPSQQTQRQQQQLYLHRLMPQHSKQINRSRAFHWDLFLFLSSFYLSHSCLDLSFRLLDYCFKSPIPMIGMSFHYYSSPLRLHRHFIDLSFLNLVKVRLWYYLCQLSLPVNHHSFLMYSYSITISTHLSSFIVFKLIILSPQLHSYHLQAWTCRLWVRASYWDRLLIF